MFADVVKRLYALPQLASGCYMPYWHHASLMWVCMAARGDNLGYDKYEGCLVMNLARLVLELSILITMTSKTPASPC